jgi:hypothetical protein
MKSIEIPLPLLATVAATRGILGLGVGLLLADALPPERRRTLGWALVAFGAVSTLPLAADVIGRLRAR